MPFAPGDKRINRAGRPKNSKNKVPSDRDIQDAYLKNADLALQTLVGMLRDEKAKNADKYKAASFIAGKCFEIIIERNKEAEGKADNKNTGKKEKETEAKEPAPMFSLKAVPNNKN